MKSTSNKSSKMERAVRGLRRYRSLILSLSAVVVFITAYLLILPALTLDKDEAVEQGGISVTTEATKDQTDALDTSVSKKTTEQAQESQTKSQADSQKVDSEQTAEKKTEEAKPEQKTVEYKAGKLSYDGKDYDIELSYDNEANIPDSAELKAKEIDKNSKDYEKYLKDSAKELGVDQDSISFARFFDIEIRKDAKKIEPKSPVHVKISYKDALNISESDTLKVVHFSEEGTKVEPEIIEDVKLNKKATEISYEQDSFSVTATVISATDSASVPQKPGNYAVLIKRTTQDGDKYYAVNNDGSLTEVVYKATTNTVELSYPFEWTFTSAHDGMPDTTIGAIDQSAVHQDWEPYNIRAAANCRDYDGNQLPVGTYFRYISPLSANGIDEESATNPSHNDAKFHNGLRFADSKLFDIHWNGSQNVSDGNYIGADFNAMHITGQQSADEAATIVLAQITTLPNVSANNETVDHIDIGVVGQGFLDVPLAYGNYYDENGNVLLTVSSQNNVTLHLEKDIPIVKEDIMKSSLKAYDKNGTELNDAFYITGYTANEHTDHSAVQVRMEGVFKVSTLPPYTGGNSNHDADRRHARLENQVYYKLATQKEVEFNLIDEDGHQLYDMKGNALKLKVILTLTASFSYWDEDNECPPVLSDFEEKYHLGYPVPPAGHNNLWWRDGAIINNVWGDNLPYAPDGTGGGAYGLPGDSGMDFILGNKGTADLRIPAIEIVKMIVDENGNRIHPDEIVSNDFKVYYNKNANPSGVVQMGVNQNNPVNEVDLSNVLAQYTELRTENLEVGSDGIGIFYDYDVEEGMFLIQEDKTPMMDGGNNQTIMDTAGKEWTYKETRVETEYVWRNNNYYRHYANGYTSVPDVLGEYHIDPYMLDGEEHDGNEYNTFLEFYVYNVYEAKKYPVEIKKIDVTHIDDPDPDGLAGAVFDLYGPYAEERTTDDGDGATGRKLVLKQKDITVPENSDGIVSIGDLSDGYYYLYETRAPDGFNCPKEPIMIRVDSAQEVVPNGKVVTYTQVGNDASANGPQVIQGEEGTESIYRLLITNNPGVVLPLTGGFGTRFYYIFGIFLIVGAGCWLLLRRRSTA